MWRNECNTLYTINTKWYYLSYRACEVLASTPTCSFATKFMFKDFAILGRGTKSDDFMNQIRIGDGGFGLVGWKLFIHISCI
jgi:hypothetical protein